MKPVIAKFMRHIFFSRARVREQCRPKGRRYEGERRVLCPESLTPNP